MKIFLNPGHDRKYDPGAVNPFSKLQEADVAYNVGIKVKQYLEAVGFQVKLAQSDNLAGEGYRWDRQTPVCQEANSWDADLFVSIHCNAFNRQAQGTETLVYSFGSASERLANYIQKQIVNSLDTVDRGVKERPELIVLKRTDMPAVLVELAFIDSPADIDKLTYKQDDFARAIARGITDYTSSV